MLQGTSRLLAHNRYSAEGLQNCDGTFYTGARYADESARSLFLLLQSSRHPSHTGTSIFLGSSIYSYKKVSSVAAA